MARIAGVDLPKNKNVLIGLTYIFGIGRSSSKKILEEAGVDAGKKVSDLDGDEVTRIRKVIENRYKVEGELRAEVHRNIKRLMDINCYRGVRHKRRLPVRGQRTHTNARTSRGIRRAKIGGKKK